MDFQLANHLATLMEAKTGKKSETDHTQKHLP